jgi:hypothetical protein
MTLRSWIRNLFARPITRPTRQASTRWLTLEALEDRTVPSAVWYVNGSAAGSNNGTSWANAYTDLQAALQNPSLSSGDQVWVAEGTYKPTSGNDRTISFALRSGVAVYGSFTGSEAQLGQRDWAHHVTTLSGDIGVPGDRSDNSYHVVTSSGLDATAILDGFTITAGNANGSAGTDGGGGGMYNDSSSPALANVTFSSNSAIDGGGMRNASGSPTLTNVNFSGNSALAGGGMSNFLSSPTLTNVTFSANSADGGGGMYNYTSSPALTNVTFSGNSTNFRGGGMRNDSSSPTLTNVTFSGNSADFGGGMANISSSPALTNVTFSDNSVGSGGGGMYNFSSSPALTNVTFTGNSASVDSAAFGGGMYNELNSSSTLTNVTFSGNSALVGGGLYNASSSPALTNVTFSGNSAFLGGGLYNAGSSPALTNVTFSGNSAGSGGGLYNAFGSPALTNVTFSGNSADIDNRGSGGGLYNEIGSPTLTNCILWGDSGGEISNVNNYSVTVIYSVVQGGWDGGTGNIDRDPLLAPLGDYGGPTQTMPLLPGSPAIDAGTSAGAPATDQRGLSRVGAVDIGAYEVQVISLSPAALPDGSYGAAYSQALTAAEAGYPGVFTLAVTAGALPSGLNLAADGVLTGTPTAAGSFSFTVTATDSAGFAASQSYTLTVNPAALSASGVSFSATAGAPFSGAVATFSNPDPSGGAAPYTVLIAWGDGTTSAGVITGTGGTLTVSGSHTYADPVNEVVSVQISHKLGYTTTATVSDKATVVGLGQGVVKGLTGGVGFWNNKNGQALIESFNGGSTATALGNWLAATFPNLYGTGAGTSSLAGKSSAQVATYFQALFALGGTQVQAQVLATALNVYATTSSLGGSAGAAYGFAVSATGLGARSYNVGKDGAAFGVANNTTLNVYQLLVAVNKKAVKGVLYGGNTTLQAQAADLFNSLDTTGGIG